ncbi:unnamed protein product [Zymoseptoria tritici ST99CH_3D1]|uniref:Uncharacterized protein n=1 Tax=Zymoseptoria tritici (strain ST99CH_3D7) TaxID=1276538 RepID=A0A1X7RV81_ZYMT9|nr:unnamed protein product [Zymoseptoria tritici ST99CH_3D7]SMR54915.1 unnamed protein product [Zymoseptoria tritici ST99CH_3D1]
MKFPDVDTMTPGEIDHAIAYYTVGSALHAAHRAEVERQRDDPTVSEAVFRIVCKEFKEGKAKRQTNRMVLIMLRNRKVAYKRTKRATTKEEEEEETARAQVEAMMRVERREALWDIAKKETERRVAEEQRKKAKAQEDADDK